MPSAELLNAGGSSYRKVLIVYTGGTMGMTHRADGSLGCQPGVLLERLRVLDELRLQRMPACYFLEFDPILDSSDMCPDDWNSIAHTVYDNYYEYDGFVIIHGTDTMAYTASALSFMLEQLAKPVVLTGSQVPYFEPLSDARQNLLGAIVFAGLADVCEVCVFFGNRLLRGNRASKVNADALQAFTSPSFPNLAELGVEVSLFQQRLLPSPKGRFRLQAISVKEILVVWLIPGFADDIFLNLLQGNLRGLVLCLYGCGNAPAKKKLFLSHLRQLVDKGVVIVACSQCAHGNVRLEKYAVGMALQDSGVVGGGDMTVEAVVTKLSYLLSKDLGARRTREALCTDLRGEISTRQAAFELGEPTSGIDSRL